MGIDRTGQVLNLAGRQWTVGRKLGAGGGGAVYVATSDGQVDHAVKFVERVQGAPRELLLEAPENVRNIVPTRAVTDAGDDYALLMPLAEHSLHDERQRCPGEWPLDKALVVLRDLATTLVDLESAKIVHRDVKPENILWYHQAWCLADFGIARLVEASTDPATRAEAKSRKYTAPERWDDRRVTCATDAYSWGVIAFELLTGRVPYLGPTLAQFKEQHQRGDVPPMSNLPDGLVALVRECLFTAPEARPAADEIVHRLSLAEAELSPGLAALRQANLSAVGRRAAEHRMKDFYTWSRIEHSRRFDAALASFMTLSDRLWTAVRMAASSAVPDRRYPDGEGWRLTLSGAPLTVAHPRRSKDDAGLTVVAHSMIEVGLRDPDADYTGRVHSLWYFDPQQTGRLGWYEAGFLYRGFPHRRSSQMPFALPPGQGAAAALASVSDEFAVVFPLTRIDYVTLDDFVDRWARWFADAAAGELRFTRPA